MVAAIGGTRDALLMLHSPWCDIGLAANNRHNPLTAALGIELHCAKQIPVVSQCQRGHVEFARFPDHGFDARCPVQK